MFYHTESVHRETYSSEGNTYELIVHRVQEDGHLNGYIVLGDFSDLVGYISGEVAMDMASESGLEPVQEMINLLKNEIEAGNVQRDT